MQHLIEMYISDRKMAWASTSLKSELARLRAKSAAINGKPEVLWDALAQQKPYTRVTTWTRVVDFYEWCLEEGHVSGANVYRAFRRKNARLFKNAYQPKLPEHSYDEALALIARIPRVSSQAKARELLTGALRYTESNTLKDGVVIGKGNKPRRVYAEQMTAPYDMSYGTFLRDLKAVGLTPHMLRKIVATALARQGLSDWDLMKVMGWNSIMTAKVYVAARQDDALAAEFKKLHGGSKNEQVSKSLPKAS